MTDRKHTALPWTIDPINTDLIIKKDTDPYLYIADCDWQVKYGNSEQGYTSDANAKFIVRACNAHYEMLEALKASLHELHDIMRSGMSQEEYDNDPTIMQVRAAIAKGEQ